MSSDWIACSERMPESDVDVLIAYADGIGTRGFGIGWRNGAADIWHTGLPVRVNITHWQPLPSPPTHAAVQAPTDPVDKPGEMR